jgi:hypothetical protein
MNKKLPLNLEPGITPLSTTGLTTEGYPGNKTASFVGLDLFDDLPHIAVH